MVLDRPTVRSPTSLSVKTAVLQSRCECQATLLARLDANCHVLSGWARTQMSADREVAPAHASEAPQRLDITWLCPFCGRNTFRSFAVDGLLWSEGP